MGRFSGSVEDNLSSIASWYLYVDGHTLPFSSGRIAPECFVESFYNLRFICLGHLQIIEVPSIFVLRSSHLQLMQNIDGCKLLFTAYYRRCYLLHGPYHHALHIHYTDFERRSGVRKTAPMSRLPNTTALMGHPKGGVSKVQSGQLR